MASWNAWWSVNTIVFSKWMMQCLRIPPVILGEKEKSLCCSFVSFSVEGLFLWCRRFWLHMGPCRLPRISDWSFTFQSTDGSDGYGSTLKWQTCIVSIGRAVTFSWRWRQQWFVKHLKCSVYLLCASPKNWINIRKLHVSQKICSAVWQGNVHCALVWDVPWWSNNNLSIFC